MARKSPAWVDDIIRKRNYGMLKEVRLYAQDIYSTVNSQEELNTAIDYVFNSYSSQVAKENFDEKQIKNQLDIIFAGFSTRLISFQSKMRRRLLKVLKMGGGKVMDTHGKTLKMAKPTYDIIVKKLAENNLKYVKNLNDDRKTKVLDAIKKGVKEGKGYNEVAKDVRNSVRELSVKRSSVIAKTEIVRATGEAMKETMTQNGISKYMWITAGDDRVAPLDKSLDRQVFEFGKKGTMNWKGTDGKTYKINKSPTPVNDTHPNCRCVIVKAP